MSIEVAFENVSIALKNLWAACFMDEEGKPLDWTKPLITSINTPKLKLVVAATDGGGMKAYTGYELPDNISITIYETPDKRVEKYLDDWMFGPKGVFNKETGKFRTRSKNDVTNIYRCIRFTTFLWETDTEGASVGAKRIEGKAEESSAGVKRIEAGVEESSAGVKLQENFSEIQKIAIKYIEKKAGRLLTIQEKENIGAYMRTHNKALMNYQQIASQITTLASGVANQMLGHIPAMSIGRVIIPPPLIKAPAGVSIGYGVEKRNHQAVNVNAEQQQLEIELRAAVSGYANSQDIDSIKKYTPSDTTQEDIEALKRFKLSGTTQEDIESIKKYSHREKVMSTTIYTCAIEGYDVVAYDYETGGPVSYTVNLSVLNYKSEYS
jgi:hypothetical protein